ncbi:MAG: hypothetical protein ACXVCP_18250 [Bdellovibrio sp.]
MTIENFLSFWSQHNIAIIESLIALVIILSLFMAYRSFFAATAKSEGMEGAGHALDTTQIEKALQKILDNQTQHPSQNIAAKTNSSEDLGMDVDLDALETDTSNSNPKEVQDLRNSLSESRKKIETLQIQLQEALQKATEMAEMSANTSSGGVDSKEADELKNKINDLEGRLAEYEIISEDIADLSRYRDENDKLKKEIEALKAGAKNTESTAASVAEEAVAVAPSADVASAPTSESSTDSVADLIDDELMKEFAAAVEGQKAALNNVAEKAGNGSEASAQTGTDTDKLMDEFENFVSKKS